MTEAQTILYNGRIDIGGPAPAQALLIRDGAIAAVGRDEELLPLAEAGTRLWDLKGCFVCPGFNDSHMHLLGFGQSLVSAQLAQHSGSLKELLRYLKEYAAAHPPREGRWLKGRGWNQDLFSDVRRMPDRRDLDAVSEDYPILITRACGHCCVVNSKALELAGIGAETPSPAGGSIGMENGKPDGRLYDNAMELLEPFLPLPDKEELKEMIRLACRALNSYGITSVQSDDYSVFRAIPFEVINEAYRELEAEGELSVRVYEQANFTELSELRRFAEAGNLSGTGSENFRIGPLKLLGDGSLGSRTAHLSRPYADEPGSCGFSLFPPEKLREMIRFANEKGMQTAVHAIGDACLDEVLDAIGLALEAHPREDHRHGIVHCQISRPEQLARIRDLKLHVYAQSIFLDYDNHIVESRVGKELALSSYAWKTLLKSGVSVSNGSDCPVELPDVMRGIECAVTRRSADGTGPYRPEEAFSVREALGSFTVRGAEASFEETRKGRIAPGFLADLVILDQDPFAVPAEALHKIRIEAAVLGGRFVYTAPDRKEEKEMETKLTLERAKELNDSQVSEAHLILHAKNVMYAMGAMADHFGGEREHWMAVGYLHDYDYEKYPDEHLAHTEAPLLKAGVPAADVRAILSHGYGIRNDVRPETELEKSLFTVDELTGIIQACARMRPHGLTDLEVKSFMKKFKDKKFAAKCDRDLIIRGCEMLGMSVSEVAQICIEGMKPYAAEIGLLGTEA